MMPVYETKRLCGKSTIKYMALGFKPCRRCSLLVKYDGDRCPYCNNFFKLRLTCHSIKETMEKVAAYKQQNAKPKYCSNCGTTKTYMKKLANYNYPKWMKDGRGGVLCEYCYNKERKLAKAMTAEPVLP